MRFSADLLGLSFLISSWGSAAAAEDAISKLMAAVPITGTPPAHVRHWMRIIWTGPMTHPVIPVYFINERRKAPKYSMTTYVGLERQEYRALVRFTYASKCSADRTIASSKKIEVDEFSGDGIRDVCVFQSDPGCRYLFGLANLPAIDWSHKDTYPLFQFEAELGCKRPLTLWHDAGGHPGP